MNKVILSGFIGKKGIDLKFTAGCGVAVATYSLAIKDYKKQGAEQTYTYVNCVTWNKQGEFLANNSDRIKRLLIEGRLQTRSYDAKDGTKKYVTEIITENVEVEEWKEDGGTQERNDIRADITPVDDGDIPF